MEQQLYRYKAHVEDVYDGDTCTVDIDLGFGTWLRGEKIRLHRIDAPEVKGSSRSKGLKSRDALRKLILDKQVYLETIKDRKEKYGRYLGEVWLKKGAGKFINVNDWMVEQALAVYRKY